MIHTVANVEIVRVTHGVGKKSGDPYVRLEVLSGELPDAARPYVEAMSLWGDPTRIAPGSVVTPCHAHVRLEIASDGRIVATDVKAVQRKAAA